MEIYWATHYRPQKPSANLKSADRLSAAMLLMQVDDLGPAGPVAYTFVYTVLELVIIPAIPLTMAAGALFGVAPGVVVVSLASTAAAALGFLITRYAARDKV
jgi:uncharacterized membrane protein YdjX (TVP38/TMEM64 family)